MSNDEEMMTPAARDVLEERRRQMQEEGWSLDHDDISSRDGSMAQAAAAYAVASIERPGTLERASRLWPWAKAWWKPTNPRRDLVKAGALILAEIERLDRAEAAKRRTR